MKLTTNFARPQLPLAQIVLAVSALVFVAAIAVAIFALIDTGVRRDDAARERLRLERWRQQLANTPAQQAPPIAAVSAMKARVAKLNRLSPQPRQAVPEVLQRLEKLLPDSAYLVHLAYKTNGDIQLIAESTGAEALTAFFVRLQQDASFAEAMLTRQSQRTTNGQRRIQFDIRLRDATPAAS